MKKSFRIYNKSLAYFLECTYLSDSPILYVTNKLECLRSHIKIVQNNEHLNKLVRPIENVFYAI